MDRVSMEELAFMEGGGGNRGKREEVSKGGREGIDLDRRQSANKREEK